MVNRVVLSEYNVDPPGQAGRTKIATPSGKPLYSLERVRALVADESRVYLWTRKCRHDVHKLFDSDLERVVDLVQALREDGYIDSEWCENGSGALAACDAYRIQRAEIIQATGKRQTIEYFLKFALGKNGSVLLLVSCHV